MKNKQVDLHVKSVNIIFPLLFVSSCLFALLEAYFYIGVLKRYILIDSRFLMILTISLVPFLENFKKNKVNGFIFKLLPFLTLASLLVYLAMTYFEVVNFPNFIFSHYHIQPNNFFNLIVFGALMIFINIFFALQNNFKKINVQVSLIIIMFVLVSFLGIANTLSQAIAGDVYILTHLNKSYNFKMAEKWGFYYEYIQFVKNNTPEDSSILVPPQETPWLSTGNVGLDRYFLYPRNLINGSLNGGADIGRCDYVMMAWGEWKDAPKEKYGWPKEDIQAEEVIYFGDDTNNVKKGNYITAENLKYGGWGLIKLKK